MPIDTDIAHAPDRCLYFPGKGVVETDLITRELLPGAALEWQEVMQAWCPVPGDGLPVMGACGPDGL